MQSSESIFLTQQPVPAEWYLLPVKWPAYISNLALRYLTEPKLSSISLYFNNHSHIGELWFVIAMKYISESLPEYFRYKF